MSITSEYKTKFNSLTKRKDFEAIHFLKNEINSLLKNKLRGSVLTEKKMLESLVRDIEDLLEDQTDIESEDLYQECVSKGRALVKRMNFYQVEIAKLALKVCDIRHGGISTNIYTLKRFASDINVHHNSLSGWVINYRDICQKIGIENPTMEDWSKANKARRVLKTLRSEENRKNSTPRSLSPYRKNLSKKEVKKLFDEAGVPGSSLYLVEKIYESARRVKGLSVDLPKNLSSEEKVKIRASINFIEEALRAFKSVDTE
ncbi:MAG: hypothetical protein GY909_15530 [Oligoflexia bacterium]|nr:hypothetical protein [Oligoflexia bacterium]